MQNSKNGLGRAKQFVWGKGFALPRLISRPQEGSGEECGQVSDWGFSEIRRPQIQKPEIEKIYDFCYACFVSKESNDSYFYTIKSSILWQLYHRTLSEYEQNKD